MTAIQAAPRNPGIFPVVCSRPRADEIPGESQLRTSLGNRRTGLVGERDGPKATPGPRRSKNGSGVRPPSKWTSALPLPNSAHARPKSSPGRLGEATRRRSNRRRAECRFIAVREVVSAWSDALTDRQAVRKLRSKVQRQPRRVPRGGRRGLHRRRPDRRRGSGAFREREARRRTRSQGCSCFSLSAARRSGQVSG